MKTKEQILRYVSHCRFPEDDWQKVLDYCRSNYGGGKAHKALKPISESTNEQFQQWIDEGLGTGDIVRYGHTLGIVGMSTPDKTYLSGYLSFDGSLIAKNMDVPSEKLFRGLDEDVAIFKDKMREEGYVYSVPLAMFVSAYRPKIGEYVKVIADGHTHVGIYQQTDDKDIFFYAVAYDNGEFSKDAAIPVKGTELRIPDKADIQFIQSELRKNKLEWNPRKCTFISTVNARVGLNEKYWYVNELFAVTMACDAHTPKHRLRYNSGNYFTSNAAALMFLEKLKEQLKIIKGDGQ